MIIVKKVGEESIPAIQELAELTWAVAYAAIIPPHQRLICSIFFIVQLLCKNKCRMATSSSWQQKIMKRLDLQLTLPK